MARLRMTNADYVAIAVSPALIMTLIGSLVFFLIEVLYVGSYEGRLTYVFALFVFASVLIARIAIELGAERAALYTLPLGFLMFLAMMRFVDHQTPFSWLINIALLVVVWWCAHKLTWDCTLIDDNEDASGEGLLGQVGLDGADAGPTSTHSADNVLFGDASDAEAPKPSVWQRIVVGTNGPHSPGLWVLYFSLAALPLFGIGQHWIPSSESDRRRHAFGLLAVYVASALALLVTTSFLGLRRYLRQRRVEMPAPMAVTWVSLGAVLILLVMFLAALLPRPTAEYALAQPPWQVAAPGDQESSEHSVGDEGTNDPDAEQRVTSDQENAPQGADAEARKNSPSSAEQARGEGSNKGEGSPPGEGEQSSESNGGESSKQAQAEQPDQSGDEETKVGDNAREDSESNEQSEDQPPSRQDSAEQAAGEDSQRESQPDGAPELPEVMERNEMRSNAPGQLMASTIALAKFAFYVLLALVVVYFAWKYRNEIFNAIAEFVRDIRAWLARLFGGRPAIVDEESTASPVPRRRKFAEFRDPFISGQHLHTAPSELVRYTFEAFEAWSGDRGRPRTPDQTAQELVQSVLPTQSPMFAEARRMAVLYGEAAYSAATMSREAATSLRTLWTMMRSHPTPASVPA